MNVDEIVYTVDESGLAGLNAHEFGRRVGERLREAWPGAMVVVKFEPMMNAVKVYGDNQQENEREARIVANDVFREMCEDRSAWLVPGLNGEKATPVAVVACMGKFSMVSQSPSEELHRVASDRLHANYAAALKAVRE